MGNNMALELLLSTLILFLGGFSTYYKLNSKLNKKVIKLITQAEEVYQDTLKSGGKKFQFVVDSLYGMIPNPLQIIFTKDRIATIVQAAFDAMETYATQQLDKLIP